MPNEDAKTISFITDDGKSHSFPLTKLDDILLQYSLDGKPLRENGPVHVLLKDGSNRDNPIQSVVAINIE